MSPAAVAVACARVTLVTWSRGELVLLAEGRQARLPVWLESQGKPGQEGATGEVAFSHLYTHLETTADPKLHTHGETPRTATTGRLEEKAGRRFQLLPSSGKSGKFESYQLKRGPGDTLNENPEIRP